MKHPIFNLPVLLTAALCLAATAVIAAVAFNPTPPPTRMLDQPLAAPSFAVVNSRGKALTPEDLRGEVYVADFFLTRCTGICPLLGARVSELIFETASDPKLKDVKFVSFSVEPEHDRPEQLRIYRERYLGAWASAGDESAGSFEEKQQMLNDRWSHVTATEPDNAAFWNVVESQFRLMVGPSSQPEDGTPVAHSSKLMLIDRQGRIRGFYDGLTDESGEPLLADLRRVVDEKRD